MGPADGRRAAVLYALMDCQIFSTLARNTFRRILLGLRWVQRPTKCSVARTLINHPVTHRCISPPRSHRPCIFQIPFSWVTSASKHTPARGLYPPVETRDLPPSLSFSRPTAPTLTPPSRLAHTV
ncbi:hypothetical protein K466DRAFT_70761 [Polyporus arcularius HHB13444]|uniref:Uncharacterized protein n=1 Tax=Polyporus arcularius HHB13444 TaxID=1314778 RepID=A0A5C3Q032_9APHY|nr:hypothetical protein K466DRAFT_70761 [Polyporus arcularius HHB13444]